MSLSILKHWTKAGAKKTLEEDLHPHFGDSFILNGEPVLQMKQFALKKAASSKKKNTVVAGKQVKQDSTFTVFYNS